MIRYERMREYGPALRVHAYMRANDIQWYDTRAQYHLPVHSVVPDQCTRLVHRVGFHADSPWSWGVLAGGTHAGWFETEAEARAAFTMGFSPLPEGP